VEKLKEGPGFRNPVTGQGGKERMNSLFEAWKKTYSRPLKKEDEKCSWHPFAQEVFTSLKKEIILRGKIKREGRIGGSPR